MRFMWVRCVRRFLKNTETTSLSFHITPPAQVNMVKSPMRFTLVKSVCLWWKFIRSGDAANTVATPIPCIRFMKALPMSRTCLHKG